MTERMVYWCDLDDPYVTLHNEFIESCWWALKKMFEKVYHRGYKVLPLSTNGHILFQPRSCSWLQRSRGAFAGVKFKLKMKMHHFSMDNHSMDAPWKCWSSSRSRC